MRFSQKSSLNSEFLSRRERERFPLDEFREALESFSFFHLGSDANLNIQEHQGRLSVSIEHDRVHPFTFQLTSEELEQLVSDSERLEAFMLEQLTRHRRHG